MTAWIWLIIALAAAPGIGLGLLLHRAMRKSGTLEEVVAALSALTGQPRRSHQPRRAVRPLPARPGRCEGYFGLPSFVQTDLTPVNREQAPLTAGRAADIVVTAATLPTDADSGTFIDKDGPVAW
jgi:hypothetical protein